VEVGAHHGAYEVLLGKLLREHGGRLIALEPNPISFEILCRNIDINGLADIVRCMKAGVSDKTGELRISDDGSQSQLIIEGQGELIEVKTLAQIPTEQDLHMVDLLVIDVEGAELPVLVGFQWDDLPLPRIFCELHPYAWKDFGYTGQDFSGFLSKKFLRCIDMYLTEHDIFNAPDYIWPTLLMR
jgi:FkbM family methyltransferase